MLVPYGRNVERLKGRGRRGVWGGVTVGLRMRHRPTRATRAPRLRRAGPSAIRRQVDLQVDPDVVASPARLRARFAELARGLLGGATLWAGADRFEILEVELYYRGHAHLDPYAHAHPEQAEPGRWYLHRQGRGFRGGSFKGLDLTFGGRGARGGILVRALRAGAEVVDGPSLVVDRLLAATEAGSPRALHARLDGRCAFDPGSPLRVSAERSGSCEPLATARVGLGLARSAAFPEMPAYVLRAYRFVAEPAAVRKGRVHTVVALHRAGATAAAIASTTRSPRPVVDRWLAAYEGARASDWPGAFVGRPPTGEALARMHGARDRAEGRGRRSRRRRAGA